MLEFMVYLGLWNGLEYASDHDNQPYLQVVASFGFSLAFSVCFDLWWIEAHFVMVVSIGFYRKNLRLSNEEGFQDQLQV